MLLFIAVTLGMTTRCLNFNTSHVTVYQSGSPYLSTVPRFQYISCYCLSDSHCMSLETQWYFNTSHVTVYHSRASFCNSFNIHFNTSHVTVYLLADSFVISINHISIHLMLLFIGVKVSYPSGRENFNTSHVTVYLTHYQTGISITIFQYISCYCLSISKSFYNCFLTISIHLMLLFINNETAQVAQEILFQYISCYCLSPSGCTTLVAVAPFQYISCYCLSVIRIAIAGADGYFNTSHVTVYRRYREPASNIVTDFNTSHVTVYHIRSIVCTTLYHISIHLMLLFIISACIYSSLQIHFNTSHVTVYPKRKTGQPYRADISIHLMLLFI